MAGKQDIKTGKYPFVGRGGRESDRTGVNVLSLLIVMELDAICLFLPH